MRKPAILSAPRVSVVAKPTMATMTREQARAQQARLLYTPQALSRWGAVTALGGLAIVGAWYNAAGKSDYNSQVGALNVGIAGLVAASVAGILLLQAGRRAVGLRRVALLGQPAPVRAVALAVMGTVGEGTPSSTTLVALEGLKRYHRSDCALAAGRPFVPAPRTAHESAGRTACGVCRP